MFDPLEREGLGEAVQFGAEVGVAEELGGAGLEEEDVFEQEGQGAEQLGGFLLAFGSGAVGFGHFEESGVVGLGGGVAKEQEGVGAGGSVGGEIEAEGFACGSLGEASDERALFWSDVRASIGEEHLDFFYWQRAEADNRATGADGGEEFAGIFGEDDDVDGGWWLFEEFEEGVCRLLHEVGCGEDKDFAGSFAGQGVGALDYRAHLAQFDEELRRVGGDDEDVGVGLDEDAGFFLVSLAQVFAGGYGLIDLFFKIGSRSDAGAVFADSAESGEGLAIGPKVAGLALALDCHCQHEGEGVFA